MQVLDRGEKIEVLVDKTENLRSQVRCFYCFPQEKQAIFCEIELGDDFRLTRGCIYMFLLFFINFEL